MEALKDNFDIAAFKIGPDYIDPMFHKTILNTPSINLDPVLVGEDRTRFLYGQRLKNKDLAVIEGVMGLYDGQSGTGAGSSACVAKLLGLPVLLVVNSRGMGRSVAALIKGYVEYDPDLDFVGILLNGVDGKRFKEQKKWIEEAVDVPVLGYLPRLEDLKLSSRHLGLKMPEEQENLTEDIKKAAAVLKETVDFDRLLKEVEPVTGKDPFEGLEGKFSGLKVAVARDEAFNFYYQDNLDVLKRLGCELIYFSPLKDREPPKADLYYFGGGYPELYKEELCKNACFRKRLKEVLEGGAYALAECGGMIYLGEKLDGVPMVGFFDYETKMSSGLKHFGYHDLRYKDFSFAVHEFHHSDYKKPPQGVFKLTKNGATHSDGFKRENVLAGYPHFHFYAEPDGPAFLIDLLEEIHGKS